jgi:hypothetical protein
MIKCIISMLIHTLGVEQMLHRVCHHDARKEEARPRASDLDTGYA